MNTQTSAVQTALVAARRAASVQHLRNADVRHTLHLHLRAEQRSIPKEQIEAVVKHFTAMVRSKDAKRSNTYLLSSTLIPGLTVVVDTGRISTAGEVDIITAYWK